MSDQEFAEGHSIREMFIRLSALASACGHSESALVYSNSAIRRGHELIAEGFRRIARGYPGSDYA